MEVSDKIEMRKINEIKPYMRNPRKNDKTVEALCELIPKVGFNVPIVVDENGIIVKGHARFRAAIKLGMEEIPCIVSHADEDAIRLDRLSDNKTSELSEWIDSNLETELDMLTTDMDLSVLGFHVEPPSMDFLQDFTEDSDDEGESYEEKLARFKEMEESAEKVEIVSEKKLEKAESKPNPIGTPFKTVGYKIVCKNCGATFYIRQTDIQEFADEVFEGTL